MILIEDNDQQTAELSNLDSFSILNVETRLLRNAPTRFHNFLFWLLIWFFQRFWKIFTFFTNQVTNAAIVSCFLMRLWSQWVQLCPGLSVFFFKVGAELQVSIFKLASACVVHVVFLHLSLPLADCYDYYFDDFCKSCYGISNSDHQSFTRLTWITPCTKVSIGILPSGIWSCFCLWIMYWSDYQIGSRTIDTIGTKLLL